MPDDNKPLPPPTAPYIDEESNDKLRADLWKRGEERRAKEQKNKK